MFITFFNSSLKPPADGASYYARRFPKPRTSYFLKIIVKLHLQAFCQNLKIEKCKNLVSVCETFKNRLI